MAVQVFSEEGVAHDNLMGVFGLSLYRV